MSTQSKFLTIGLILAFGIGNAYYSFNPSLKEMKEQREAEAQKLSEAQKNAASQPEPSQQQNKSV